MGLLPAALVRAPGNAAGTQAGVQRTIADPMGATNQLVAPTIGRRDSGLAILYGGYSAAQFVGLSEAVQLQILANETQRQRDQSLLLVCSNEAERDRQRTLWKTEDDRRYAQKKKTIVAECTFFALVAKKIRHTLKYYNITCHS